MSMRALMYLPAHDYKSHLCGWFDLVISVQLCQASLTAEYTEALGKQILSGSNRPVD